MRIEPDPLRSGLTGKNCLPAGMTLLSRQNDPVACQFRTAYPVDLLPLSLYDATLYFDSDELSWQLRLQFQVWPGAHIKEDKIRLYLHGPGNIVNTLYTLLCSEVKSLTLHQSEICKGLAVESIRPVGFEVEESLVTRDPRVSPVHTLLLDYYYFPQKFSFIDISLPAGFSANTGEEFELQAVFKRNPLTARLEKLAGLIDVSFFRLNCTPAVNLFLQRAEPITLTDITAEHLVVPEIRHQSMLEIWSIDQVSVQRKTEDQLINYSVYPLLESSLCIQSEDDLGLRWQSLRREVIGAQGIEQKLFIAFSELSPPPESSAGSDIITISTLCTNHVLPHQMQYGHPEGDFDCDAAIAGLKVFALTHPTRPVSPPEKNAVRWHFLSQLSLNHQLFAGKKGTERLKETLALYHYGDQPVNSRLINFIHNLTYQPVTTRLTSNDPHSLARGLDLTVTFGHGALQEPDYFLLCSLLDRLLALYAPVNSFTRLTTCIENEEQTRRQWPIRAGRLSWL
jgi:type VI secretion system protein ImpG